MTPADHGSKTPTATLELAPMGDDWSVAFTLRNPSDKPIEATVHEPFLSFTLTVLAVDSRALELVQPALDVPVHPVALNLLPDEMKRLGTPIRLHFDPRAAPTGGDDPFVWSIVSERVPVVVKARLTIDGIAPIDTQARVSP
jgi:hypothetical protein